MYSPGHHNAHGFGWESFGTEALSLSLSLFYGPKCKRENATILIHTLKPTPCKIHTAYSIPLPQYIQNLPKSTGMHVEFYILVVVKSFSACHCVKNNCFFVFSLPFYSFPPSLSGPYFSVLPGVMRDSEVLYMSRRWAGHDRSECHTQTLLNQSQITKCIYILI